MLYLGRFTYIDSTVVEVDNVVYTLADGTVLRNEVGVIEYTGGAAIAGFLNNGDQVFDIVANADNRISSFKYVAAEADRDAAKLVIDEINALDSESATFAADVAAARASYNALTATQQNLVTNLADLVAAEAQVEANTFTTNHAAILAETVDTVEVSDEAAVTAALTDYNALSVDAKALVADEKALLDDLQDKIDELKATADANTFTTNHAAILDETVDTVEVGDETAVDNALSDYDGLSDAAKALVEDEKALLDDLEARIDAIIAVNDAVTAISVSDMRTAIEDANLGLDLTEYNNLLGAQKDVVAQYMIDNAPGGGYTDTASVQAVLDAAI